MKRKFHDQVDVHDRALKAPEVDPVVYSSIVVPVLLKKLHENIKLVVTRGNEESEHWKVEQFLQALLREVELREVHSRSTQPTLGVRRKPEMTTASELFTKKNNFGCAHFAGEITRTKNAGKYQTWKKENAW